MPNAVLRQHDPTSASGSGGGLIDFHFRQTLSFTFTIPPSFHSTSRGPLRIAEIDRFPATTVSTTLERVARKNSINKTRSQGTEATNCWLFGRLVCGNWSDSNTGPSRQAIVRMCYHFHGHSALRCCLWTQFFFGGFGGSSSWKKRKILSDANIPRYARYTALSFLFSFLLFHCGFLCYFVIMKAILTFNQISWRQTTERNCSQSHPTQ